MENEHAPKDAEVDIKLWKERLIQQSIERVVYWKQFGAMAITQYEESISSLASMTINRWPSLDSARQLNVMTKKYDINLKYLMMSGRADKKSITSMKKEFLDKKFDIIMQCIKDRGQWGKQAEYSIMGLPYDYDPNAADSDGD